MSTISARETNNPYASYYKDGLTDVFLGFALMFVGLFIWLDTVWMGAIFIPVFLPSFQAARKRFLAPRLGDLGAEPQVSAKNQKATLMLTLLLGLLMLAGVGTFFLFNVSEAFSTWMQSYFLLILGGVCASMWVMAAVMLKLKHFYLHAVVTFVAFSAVQLTVLPFGAAFLILGGGVALVGLLIVIRFMQQYPVMD